MSNQLNCQDNTRAPEDNRQHSASGSSSSGELAWRRMADELGTRPAVNRYSLARYSPDEWEAHNAAVLDNRIIDGANSLHYHIKGNILETIYDVDRYQAQTQNNLRQRAKEIFRWKEEVKNACEALSKEVELVETERCRLKRLFQTLMTPASITKECIDLRSNRIEIDLVYDVIEIELMKESEMIASLRIEFTKLLEEIDEQQVRNKAAKQSIEHDFCNKESAHSTDCMNLGQNARSNTIMFRAGATKYPEYSAASEEHWLYYCSESVNNTEAVRQHSCDLRQGINDKIMTAARKLRAQADHTDLCFANSIRLLNQLLTKLQKSLHETLATITQDELLITETKMTVRKLDAAMKLAQTRLDNRNQGLRHGERIRDKVHNGLIEEVNRIHRAATAMRQKLETLENNLKNLVNKRLELEREIALKKQMSLNRPRTLWHSALALPISVRVGWTCLMYSIPKSIPPSALAPISIVEAMECHLNVAHCYLYQYRVAGTFTINCITMCSS